MQNRINTMNAQKCVCVNVCMCVSRCVSKRVLCINVCLRVSLNFKDHQSFTIMKHVSREPECREHYPMPMECSPAAYGACSNTGMTMRRCVIPYLPYISAHLPEGCSKRLFRRTSTAHHTDASDKARCASRARMQHSSRI